MKTSSLNILPAALGLLALGLFQTTASAVILYPLDNGFENINLNPTVSEGTSLVTGLGASAWTFTTNSGLVSNNIDPTNGAPFGGIGVTNATNLNNAGSATTSGNGQAAWLEAFSGGNMNQTFGGWLDGEATITFGLQAWKGSTAAAVLTVRFNSTIVGTFNTTNQGTFTSFTTLPFATTAGTHNISFQGGVGNPYVFVDNISVTVPEPTSIVLLGLSIGFLTLGSRKRRVSPLTREA